MANDLESFTRAYIVCALWSTNDESNESGGEPLDSNYDADDIAPGSLRQIGEECKAFYEAHLADIQSVPGLNYCSDGVWTRAESAGHDFWLTRCGHGAGFWDRDDSIYTKEARDRLTEAAKVAGDRTLYVGDDGMIHYGEG